MNPFEGDETKNRSNRLKHGVGFELALEFEGLPQSRGTMSGKTMVSYADWPTVS